MVGKYPVITLCGSTKFKKEFIEAQRELTLKGYIVISVGLFENTELEEFGRAMITEKEKQMIDDMHFRKIDMADSIMIINKNDYIGWSTNNEIQYAKRTGKKVEYYFPHKEGN